MKCCARAGTREEKDCGQANDNASDLYSISGAETEDLCMPLLSAFNEYGVCKFVLIEFVPGQGDGRSLCATCGSTRSALAAAPNSSSKRDCRANMSYEWCDDFCLL